MVKKSVLVVLLLSLIISSCSKSGDRYVKKATTYFKNKEYEKALPLYKKACEKDNIEGCKKVAYFYEKGLGVAIDLNKSDTYNVKACDLGNGESCFYMAQIKADEISGFMFYSDKACELDFASACLSLGNAYINGFNENLIKIEKDIEKGINYIDKACFLNKELCINLADIYMSGQDFPQDYQKAKRYFEITMDYYDDLCKKEDSDVACKNLEIIKARYVW